eukprot:3784141-Prymnesium_polylepis.1
MVQALLWGEWREWLAHRLTIGAGTYHTAFVSGEGRPLTCGFDEDDDGRLGHGEEVTVVPVPTVVPGLAAVRVISVAAGNYHTLALSDEGSVYVRPL